MKTPQRKIGAPPKRTPTPGERFQIGVRITPEMKQRLEAAAEQSGRSLTQEAEMRLERTFDRQDLLAEVLTTAYGSKEVAGLVMLLGDALQNAGFARYGAGRSWRDVLAHGRGAWTTNYDAYAQAVQAVHKVLDALRPKVQDANKNRVLGGVDIGGFYRLAKRDWSKIGKTVAEQRLASIHALLNTCGSADDAPDPRFLAFEMLVAELLGSVAKRITTHPDYDHVSPSTDSIDQETGTIDVEGITAGRRTSTTDHHGPSTTMVAAGTSKRVHRRKAPSNKRSSSHEEGKR